MVALDPTTGAILRTIDLGDTPAAAVRGGFGSLWVTRPSGVLTRIDPISGDVVAEIELGSRTTFLTIGPDAVWVMSQLGNVFRVDPATNELVATIEANPWGISGGDIVAGPGAVWVQAETRLAVQIDPTTNTVVKRLLPSAGSGSIAITADGAVWITAHDAFVLYRIPPS